MKETPATVTGFHYKRIEVDLNTRPAEVWDVETMRRSFGRVQVRIGGSVAMSMTPGLPWRPSAVWSHFRCASAGPPHVPSDAADGDVTNSERVTIQSYLSTWKSHRPPVSIKSTDT